MHSRLFPLLLFALPAALGAQAASTATPSSESGPRISPAYGVHYGTPLRFSVAAGAALDFNRTGSDGVTALVEQGQHGHEFSLGYFHMIGRLGSGVSLRASALRTAGEPWNADPHTTYVGGELGWMLVFGVGGRAGYFRRASSQATGTNSTIATLGISIGA